MTGIWQVRYKLYKISFLYTFYRPDKKTARIWSFAPTCLFYIIFTDGLSIWAYPCIIMYLNIIKTFHLIGSKNILGTLYATNAPGFWIMHLLVLLKMTLMIFFKKCSVNNALIVDRMLFLGSKINRLHTRDYYFHRCTLRSETIFWKLKAL